MSLAVWWVKRDMRLGDNPALAAAVRGHPQVLPVFCHEPSLVAAADTGPMHAHAWTQALADLRRRLRRAAADVYVSGGEVVDTFEAVRRWFPFAAVYAHEEIGNGLTYARDRAVAAWCRGRGVAYKEFPQSSVRRAGVDRDKMAELWRDRVARARPLPAVARVPLADAARRRCAATTVPEVPGSPDWQPVTETHAGKTLANFLADRGYGYAGGISSPNTAFVHGSRLSPHLAWGTLSVRQAYHATVDRLRHLDWELAGRPELGRWQRSLKNFLARLHWRDHFVQRLESEPGMEFHALHPAYRALPWGDDPKLLAAWAVGRTGFPLVDAVMRCLSLTGFANFRMRAMAASFACHALHLDWRTIHPHLARVFRDYEPGIHLSQLQMQAGVVGINSIRVYSPHKQLADQDPRCQFVRRWVPELRGATDDAIHNHHVDPAAGYPPPVVDFGARTRAMKDLLFAVRKTQSPADTADVYRRHGSRRRPLARAARRRPVGRPDQPTLF